MGFARIPFAEVKRVDIEKQKHPKDISANARSIPLNISPVFTKGLPTPPTDCTIQPTIKIPSKGAMTKLNNDNFDLAIGYSTHIARIIAETYHK